MKKINLKTKILVATVGLSLTGAAILPQTTAFASQNSAKLDFSKVQDIALDEAKEGKVTQVELKGKKNKPIYEVKVLTDTTEKEYKIDGNSGKVLRSETEDTSNDKEDVALSKATPKLSLNDATKKAKEKYAKAKVHEVSFDKENNKEVYEVKLINGNKKVKLVLDANSGEILSEKTKTK